MYTISREIGIDAGHRVPTHGSKCKHLHGHRYTIQAICESKALHETGEQKDMTLDFGFLKNVMMNIIDYYCDHGLILWSGDPLVEYLINDEQRCNDAADTVRRVGFATLPEQLTMCGKLYIIPRIPTAEVLAEHWFYRLVPGIVSQSKGVAELVSVKVWETPNCWASYEKSVAMTPFAEKILTSQSAEDLARRAMELVEEGR